MGDLRGCAVSVQGNSVSCFMQSRVGGFGPASKSARYPVVHKVESAVVWGRVLPRLYILWREAVGSVVGLRVS